MKKSLKLLLIFLCLLGIVLSSLFYFAYHQYYRYLETRKNIRSLERDFEQLRIPLARTTRFYPLPVFWLETGKLYVSRAMAEVEFGDPVKAIPYLEQANQALIRAVQGCPVDYEAFWELSKVYFLYNYPVPVYADKGRKLCQEAIRRHPYNEFINLNVLMVFFEQWPLLEAREKAWVKDRIRIMTGVDAAFIDKLKGRWWAYHRETKTLESRLGELGL
ncbi:MAG: hypothetical protein H5U07_08000 [Candidatus Aminicenantes bacterium]|nr:hypothetical protein [Candidatus Aminicenantes bacterium]